MTIKICKWNQKCRKLCNKARVNKSTESFLKYKSYRNTLNRLKLSEKRTHYKKLFDKISNNSRNLWSVFNSLMKKQNNKSDIVKIRDVNNVVHTDDRNICNIFNRHFLEAG